MVHFGQIVLGPPGSGKTTYVASMSEPLRSLGRKVAIINLDPANESIGSEEYTPDINIGELIHLEDVMSSLGLGPNGALIYCMEFLESNVEWLIQSIKKIDMGTYIMIDCPGQVELYTHNTAVKSIIKKLESQPLDVRLAAVHLVDAHYCSDPGKYISVCLTSLNTMLQIELPHINVLSKVDLIEKCGKLRFNIDYYTEVLDLNYLINSIDNDPFYRKYKKMNKAITDLVDNYSLVNFIPLSVKCKEQMLVVRNAVDKANGYCFGSEEERNLKAMMSSAMGDADFEYNKTSFVRENYMDADKSYNDEPEVKREKFGNDLDNIDISPGFQI
uniref:GPN-loop GTPase 2 n=1 Tax=Lepeophtheirus salmonis TaxID=72036 RepID=C1BRW4_LEPSM|nr:ATP-binding domain 1 family member B [Lepeophtheirus salmonis]